MGMSLPILPCIAIVRHNSRLPTVNNEDFVVILLNVPLVPVSSFKDSDLHITILIPTP